MAKKNKEGKQPVGRPPEHKAPEDTAKGHMISLTPNEDKQLISIYGGRTEAVKQLLRPEIIKAYLDLK